MTSPLKMESNRANARQSTGPRTEAGKARSARNALKHGLSGPVASDDDTAQHIASLARSLVGDQAQEPLIWSHAQQIAEAELDLLRIRQVRAQAWDRQFAKWSARAKQVLPDKVTVAAYYNLSSLLTKIDRYERRALSRRRTAVKALSRALQVTERPHRSE